MFEDIKGLSKFEQKFLQEFYEDIEKREDSIWLKGWNGSNIKNAFTNHEYQGINSFLLNIVQSENKYIDNRFATFLQAKENGYSIKKGSKGIPIQYFNFYNIETKKLWNQKEFEEKSKLMTEEEMQIELSKKRVIEKTYYVFNAENLINLENNKTFSENNPLVLETKKEIINELSNRFENELINSLNIEVVEIYSDKAFYRINEDKVYLPLFEQFKSYEIRLATLIHELGHATGHKTRLNRDLSGEFGSSKYAKEELIVELNSVFMCNELGIELSDEMRNNHLRYLDNWKTRINEDPKEFISIIKDSLKIKDYMKEHGKYKEIFFENNINKDEHNINKKDISEEFER